jgi:hypothetical protein
MQPANQSNTDNIELPSNKTLSSPGKYPAQPHDHSAWNELLWCLVPVVLLLGPFAIPGLSKTLFFLVIVGICYAIFVVLMVLAIIQNLTRKSGSHDHRKM